MWQLLHSSSGVTPISSHTGKTASVLLVRFIYYFVFASQFCHLTARAPLDGRTQSLAQVYDEIARKEWSDRACRGMFSCRAGRVSWFCVLCLHLQVTVFACTEPKEPHRV